MTPKQRFLAVLEGRTPDRVPVFLRDLTLGLDILDYTTPEVCAGGPGGGYDAEKSAQAICAAWCRFGQDAVVGSIHDLGADVEFLGGITDFPERGIPRVIHPPFADLRRFHGAEVPQMDHHGRLPGMLEACRQVKSRVGDGAAVAANIEGPITKAAIFRGTKELMLDFGRNPDLAREIVAFAADVSISHLTFMAGAGADFVFVAAATDGPVLVNPKIFLSHTIPHLARIVAAARELGLKVIFHPHGRFTDKQYTHLVEASLETGIAGFQFPENCDLRLAHKKWGRRIAVLGGIDIATALTPGPVDRIRREVKELMDDLAAKGNYIFMPSCSLHRGDPLDHIAAMMEAAREYGNINPV